MNDQLRPQGFTPTQASKPLWFQNVKIFRILAIVFMLFIGVIIWFLFTADAIRFESNAPDTVVEVTGGIVIPSGPSFLMRPGTYRYHATAPKFKNRTEEFVVTGDGNHTYKIDLQPKPGIITLESEPPGATVHLEGTSIGVTPLVHNIEAGEANLEFTKPRYQTKKHTEVIEGLELEQTIAVKLEPDWADVWIETTPNGARVSIDGAPTRFRTPGPIEVLSGEHRITIDSPGYKPWVDIVFIRAGEHMELDAIQLEPYEATLNVNSDPPGASITVNDQYVGVAPIQVYVSANEPQVVKAILAGFEESKQTISIESEGERTARFNLEPRIGDLIVTTEPEEVEIWIDGELHGRSNATLRLREFEQEVILKKTGFADYKTSITPRKGIPHELKVRLLTTEEARMEALKRVRATIDGHQLVLLQPTTIRMGASRREPGRRANEVFRTTNLTRLFYLSRHEVTNAQFKLFASAHDSGEFQGVTLDRDQQPVSNVSWREAAQYCNWLSEREGFEPFYIISPAIEVKVNRDSLGYRLPTEAEWSWAARTIADSTAVLHFPWGDELPPPNRHGNYADLAAQHIIGRIIFDYNDNQIVASNVGLFSANSRGLFDMGGNVAEWTHDYYHIPANNSSVPELGPATGEYRVIRGSSWKHGTITDLRLTYRDYGDEGRDDVGFRIARYAE